MGDKPSSPLGPGEDKTIRFAVDSIRGLWVAVDSVRRREGGWCDHLAAIL